MCLKVKFEIYIFKYFNICKLKSWMTAVVLDKRKNRFLLTFNMFHILTTGNTGSRCTKNAQVQWSSVWPGGILHKKHL